MNKEINEKLRELLDLKEKQATKVTKEDRETIPAKKEELINLIKEL
jgi:hypothetical protein